MTSTFDTTLANLGIGRTGAAATPTVLDRRASQTLGQADFLKLMTAQLQNQDPFTPVDNTQMVAQMAQFSSLSGITDMITTLKAIADQADRHVSTADALSYVGKTVLTEGDTAYRAHHRRHRRRGRARRRRDRREGHDPATPTAQVLKTLTLGAQTARAPSATTGTARPTAGSRRRHRPVQGHRHRAPTAAAPSPRTHARLGAGRRRCRCQSAAARSLTVAGLGPVAICRRPPGRLIPSTFLKE